MALLPISIINIICEYAAELDDAPWIPVFDEKTHDMKKVVNKYSSRHIKISNRILDRNAPMNIRLQLNSELLDVDICSILTYPSIKYYIRNIAYNIAIFFDSIDGETKGSIWVDNKYYPLDYANFSHRINGPHLEIFSHS